MGTIEETKMKAEKEKDKAKGKKMEAEVQEKGAAAVEEVAKVGETIKKKIIK